MKTITAGVLEVAYHEIGPADGPPAILLHGFPYDTHSYDDVSRRLSDKGVRCLMPYLRGYGATRFRSSDTPRSGQQAALGVDLLLMGQMLANARRHLIAIPVEAEVAVDRLQGSDRVAVEIAEAHVEDLGRG